MFIEISYGYLLNLYVNLFILIIGLDITKFHLLYSRIKKSSNLNCNKCV